MFGTCTYAHLHAHHRLCVGPMHNYEINPQAGIVLILDPHWIYMLTTSHKYTPEQSNNRAHVIS